MSDLTFGIDDESVTQYLKKKLPDWHMRLRVVESEQKEFRTSIDKMVAKMNDVHVAVLGSIDGQKRGILRRLEIIEAWKRIASWASGIMFIAYMSAIVKVMLFN